MKFSDSKFLTETPVETNPYRSSIDVKAALRGIAHKGPSVRGVGVDTNGSPEYVSYIEPDAQIRRYGWLVGQDTEGVARIEIADGAYAHVPIEYVDRHQANKVEDVRESVKAALGNESSVGTVRPIRADLHETRDGHVGSSGDISVSLAYQSTLGAPSEDEVMTYVAARYPGARVLDAEFKRDGLVGLMLHKTSNVGASRPPESESINDGPAHIHNRNLDDVEAKGHIAGVADDVHKQTIEPANKLNHEGKPFRDSKFGPNYAKSTVLRHQPEERTNLRKRIEDLKKPIDPNAKSKHIADDDGDMDKEAQLKHLKKMLAPAVMGLGMAMAPGSASAAGPEKAPFQYGKSVDPKANNGKFQFGKSVDPKSAESKYLGTPDEEFYKEGLQTKLNPDGSLSESAKRRYMEIKKTYAPGNPAHRPTAAQAFQDGVMAQIEGMDKGAELESAHGGEVIETLDPKEINIEIDADMDLDAGPTSTIPSNQKDTRGEVDRYNTSLSDAVAQEARNKSRRLERNLPAGKTMPIVKGDPRLMPIHRGQPVTAQRLQKNRTPSEIADVLLQNKDDSQGRDLMRGLINDFVGRGGMDNWLGTGESMDPSKFLSGAIRDVAGSGSKIWNKVSDYVATHGLNMGQSPGVPQERTDTDVAQPEDSAGADNATGANQDWLHKQLNPDSQNPFEEHGESQENPFGESGTSSLDQQQRRQDAQGAGQTQLTNGEQAGSTESSTPQTAAPGVTPGTSSKPAPKAPNAGPRKLPLPADIQSQQNPMTLEQAQSMIDKSPETMKMSPAAKQQLVRQLMNEKVAGKTMSVFDRIAAKHPKTGTPVTPGLELRLPADRPAPPLADRPTMRQIFASMRCDKIVAEGDYLNMRIVWDKDLFHKEIAGPAVRQAVLSFVKGYASQTDRHKDIGWIGKPHFKAFDKSACRATILVQAQSAKNFPQATYAADTEAENYSGNQPE